jgi:hypothetical protein
MTKMATVQAQQRWEYMSISRKTESYLAGELNILGQDGWELVTINYARGKKEEMFWTAFLKRPAAGHAAPVTTQQAAPARHDPTVPDPGVQKSFESLEGFDLDGDTFTIHEEPAPKTPEEPEQQ